MSVPKDSPGKPVPPDRPTPPVPPDSLSRRRLLTTAAAASLAAACEPAAPPPPVLAFVGPDPAQAHSLRDPAFRNGPVTRELRTQVAIVGGGVAGLSAAWRLRKAGLRDFHLVELEPELGGTARGGLLPRSPHPLGAHYLPSPHPECAALELLLTELGLIIGRDHHGRAEYLPSAIVSAPSERHQVGLLWHEGLYPDRDETPDEAAQWARWREHLLALDARRGADGRRLFRLPVDLSSAELRHLDSISLARYLDDLGLNSWRLRWAVDYATRDDYGCTAAQTSAFAGLHHFLARGLEDNRDGHTLTAPDGNARLIRGLATLVGGTLELHNFSTKLRTRLHADAILWAAPRFVLPHVLPPGRDPLAANTLSYAPWLVASVELRARPRGVGAPLAWDNVPVAPDAAQRSLGYVLATHGEDRSVRDPGAVITYYEPLPGDDAAALSAQRTRLLSTSLADWSEHVRAALVAMHPNIAREIAQIHVTRWGHAMIRPVPGLLFGDALATARAPIARVRPCAADITGLPLFEEAFYAGVRAAEAALTQLGHAATSIIES
ncbi:MAG: NAD(P)-binding protein [Nannocystis sp.]|uniref:NAD(P)-binding protein n=1 Tax=Nannocystis sp. TaxID=1962667 RepID=UPI002424CB3F|nr:NAD(P)-binding protein [Nannocystis sp.]MBK9753643.1 NAD(P)-binding protein [Nannocystis sp.]